MRIQSPSDLNPRVTVENVKHRRTTSQGCNTEDPPDYADGQEIANSEGAARNFGQVSTLPNSRLAVTDMNKRVSVDLAKASSKSNGSKELSQGLRSQDKMFRGKKV